MQNIQYNNDKTLVTVPYQEWLNLQLKLKTLQNKLRVFASIQNGINEIKEAKNRENNSKNYRILFMKTEVRITKSFRKAIKPFA
jgi:hypothetical protein